MCDIRKQFLDSFYRIKWMMCISQQGIDHSSAHPFIAEYQNPMPLPP